MEVVLAAVLARSKEPVDDHNIYYPTINSMQMMIYSSTIEQSLARALLARLYIDFGNAAIFSIKIDATP